MKRPLLSVFSILILALAGKADASDLWDHGVCDSARETVELHNRADEVSERWSDVKQKFREANIHIGHGVLSEFQNAITESSELKPQEFRYVLQGYILTRIALTEMEHAIERLQAMDSRCRRVREYETALAGKLAAGGFIPGLSEVNLRYADAAGLSGESISKHYGTSAMHAAWRSELADLLKSTDEVIRNFRDFLPLAEEGKFASAMLSGQNSLGFRLLHIINAYSEFDRRYIGSVTASIEAAMEVYPLGFEWLTTQ